MKLELKNISHNVRLSEETNAFAADLYINGVKRGVVSNRGNGGSDHFTDHAAERELNEYGKTLPHTEYCGTTFPQSAESLVNDVLEVFLNDKRERGLCKNKTCFSTPDMPKGEYRTLKGWSAETVKYVRENYPTATILNLKFMPEPTATNFVLFSDLAEREKFTLASRMYIKLDAARCQALFGHRKMFRVKADQKVVRA